MQQCKIILLLLIQLKNNFLLRQYLFAQHVHVCLDLEKSLKEEHNSLVYLKYGNELWNSIVFLKNTITNKSKMIFQQANIPSLVFLFTLRSINL